MPESKKRKKAVYTSPTAQVRTKKPPSPPWFAPVMVGVFVLGIAWLAVYYIAGDSVPGMKSLDQGNLAVGFGIILVGFALATQWR